MKEKSLITLTPGLQRRGQRLGISGAKLLLADDDPRCWPRRKCALRRHDRDCPDPRQHRQPPVATAGYILMKIKTTIKVRNSPFVSASPKWWPLTETETSASFYDTHFLIFFFAKFIALGYIVLYKTTFLSICSLALFLKFVNYRTTGPIST